MEFMVYTLRLLSGAGIRDEWTSGDVWEGDMGICGVAVLVFF